MHKLVSNAQHRAPVVGQHLSDSIRDWPVAVATRWATSPTPA
jgi:hypothetical protein